MGRKRCDEIVRLIDMVLDVGHQSPFQGVYLRDEVRLIEVGFDVALHEQVVFRFETSTS